MKVESHDSRKLLTRDACERTPGDPTAFSAFRRQKRVPENIEEAMSTSRVF